MTTYRIKSSPREDHIGWEFETDCSTDNEEMFLKELREDFGIIPAVYDTISIFVGDNPGEVLISRLTGHEPDDGFELILEEVK